MAEEELRVEIISSSFNFSHIYIASENGSGRRMKRIRKELNVNVNGKFVCAIILMEKIVRKFYFISFYNSFTDNERMIKIIK